MSQASNHSIKFILRNDGKNSSRDNTEEDEITDQVDKEADKLEKMAVFDQAEGEINA